MLELRHYQQRSLDELEAYLRRAGEHGGMQAFLMEAKRQYRSVPQLPGLPYVCVRIPTGGGKTFMACHAVGIAARVYLEEDRAVCLWLVPSNTIREQTLKALGDRQHGYRQALDARFAGQVEVMDITDALSVRRSVLEGATVVIVSTLAALRVEDTEGRKVYEEAGALQHHFSGLAAGLETELDRREDGSVIPSLANVLRLWRPVVIVDEAHNARTPLSFETLSRFSPSCIVEFTATPEFRQQPEQGRIASNILCHVSAAELKAEEMIKLPVRLRVHEDWKETIAEAVDAQRTLEKAAGEEEQETGEYLRPVVLLQAQPRSQQRQNLTVEIVKQCLLEDFKIPGERIAVATGDTREIDDVDVFSRDCPLRFIITVYALKEGWDCSFAYVLCSVADISSPRHVEQILGRVLRMPGAKRKQRPELNCAYAFAASARFGQAANSLRDALVENGFQRLEARDFVVGEQEGGVGGPGTLFYQVYERLLQPPDLSLLSTDLRGRVSYSDNDKRLTVVGPMTADEMETLQSCVRSPEDEQAVERLYQASQGRAPGTALVSMDREPFRVPVLAIRVGGQLEMLEESHFLDREWNLAQCDPTISESEFRSEETGSVAGEVDVSDSGRIEIRFVERLHEQLTMLLGEPGWTVAQLANWLDHEIPHRDIPKAQSSLFIYNALSRLMETRGMTVEQLARHKFRLRGAVELKIEEHRRAQAKRAFDALLFGEPVNGIEVSPELCFSYEEERYSPNSYYDGPYAFRKHYFRRVGGLESEGEEFDCAVFLDSLREVKCWVRNLERRPESSFWLQTSSDRFYPDFVAMLEDGRCLVVECKGEHLWSNDDSKEKRAVGELWADRSGGRCVFVMPKGSDWGAIKHLV